MQLGDFYITVGGNVDSVLQRLPSVGMIKKFLLKFVDDPFYGQLKKAFYEGDIPTAFRAAHTIKGTAANLGLADLAKVSSDLTEQLRNADRLPDESYLKAVDEAYKSAIDGIMALD